MMTRPSRFVPFGILIVGLAAQRTAAQTTTTVDATDQGVTSGHCSLQEAIYAGDLPDTLDGTHGIAVDATYPDHSYTTGCAKGRGQGDTQAFQSRLTHTPVETGLHHPE